MMMKNNNQMMIRKIAQRSLKCNRIRNLFAILAIVLTTFMFTSVFSIGFSIAKNMKTMLLREQGTKASITLVNPSNEQIKKINENTYLVAAGIQIPIGKMYFENGSNISLEYYDQTEFIKNYKPAISNVVGYYPKKQNEIMLSESALKELKITTPKKGMTIILNLEGENKEFRLCGWFKNYETFSVSYHAFVSKEYVQKAGLNVFQNGLLSISAKSGKQNALLKDLEANVTLNKNQKFQAGYDCQDESGSYNLSIGVIIGIINLIIIFSGYLLIYNVMYISVTKDIRFYGMLKTLGTSPRQIKKMVKMQAVRLCSIGIPCGIILGTVVSFALVPFALVSFALQILQNASSEAAMPSEITFQPFIYILTVLFAIVTVEISCRKPARLASRVSPVEALRFSGEKTKKKRRVRKKWHTNEITSKTSKVRTYSKNGQRITKMAFRNVFREKKRAILVFASLFMGTMAFLSVNTFIGCLKLNDYIDFNLPNDISIYTSDNQKEVSKLYNQLKKIDGIKHIDAVNIMYCNLQYNQKLFKPFIEMDKKSSSEQNFNSLIEQYITGDIACECPIISVDANMIRKYNKRAYQKVNIADFESGKTCIVGTVDTTKDADYLLGNKITITDSKSKKSKSFEIGSVVLSKGDGILNVGDFEQMPAAPHFILVSHKTLKQLNKNARINNIVIDIQNKSKEYVTSKVNLYCQNNTSVYDVQVRDEMTDNFKTSMTSINLLGSGISVVLILIGILNFINVMLTAIFTRRQEFAMLESVGMTKRQIRKMIFFEGLYYCLLTIMLIFTVGSGILYIIVKAALKVADYAVFYYPIIQMFGISFVIIIICLTIPIFAYCEVSKDSVTERLRQID